MWISEMDEKNQRKLFVFKIIAFESGTKNSHSCEKDTCDWQSMWYETALLFRIMIYSESSSLIVMKKCDENALMQVLQVFGTF